MKVAPWQAFDAPVVIDSALGRVTERRRCRDAPAGAAVGLGREGEGHQAAAPCAPSTANPPVALGGVEGQRDDADRPRWGWRR